MAQYESDSRTPKEDLVKSLAGVLEVSSLALQFSSQELSDALAEAFKGKLK